jgi:hypothetical protein
MNAPGGICPLQSLDICYRPIRTLEKGFPTYEQVGIDCKGEVSPILVVQITGQTSSRKRVSQELDQSTRAQNFWGHDRKSSKRRT